MRRNGRCRRDLYCRHVVDVAGDSTMKVLFLRTHTADNEKNWLSMDGLGHDVHVLQYDHVSHDYQSEIVEQAIGVNPDVIIYIGAIEKYHNKPVLQPPILLRMRGIAPTIHICGDGSDKAWWEWLEAYDRHECFDLQVSIDGNFNTPLATMERGLIKLTPSAPHLFPNVPWAERNQLAGLTGGFSHGERADLISYLSASMDVHWLRDATYAEMGAFMGRCKAIVNCPMNGTGDGDHVKGRVIETGFSGACLFERKNEWTARWFKPGEEYVEYADWKDAYKKVQWAKQNDEQVRIISRNFYHAVMAKHAPAVFWKDVFGRVGL